MVGHALPDIYKGFEHEDYAERRVKAKTIEKENTQCIVRSLLGVHKPIDF